MDVVSVRGYERPLANDGNGNGNESAAKQKC